MAAASQVRCGMLPGLTLIGENDARSPSISRYPQVLLLEAERTRVQNTGNISTSVSRDGCCLRMREIFWLACLSGSFERMFDILNVYLAFMLRFALKMHKVNLSCNAKIKY